MLQCLRFSSPFSKSFCPWVHTEPRWAGEEEEDFSDKLLCPQMQFCGVGPGCCLSVPKADSLQKHWRHGVGGGGPKFSNPLGVPRHQEPQCGPHQAWWDFPLPVAHGLRLSSPKSRRPREGFQPWSLTWEVSPRGTTRGSETRQEGRPMKGASLSVFPPWPVQGEFSAAGNLLRDCLEHGSELPNGEVRKLGISPGPHCQTAVPEGADSLTLPACRDLVRAHPCSQRLASDRGTKKAAGV